jgi:hypothetical protein
MPASDWAPASNLRLAAQDNPAQARLDVIDRTSLR